MIITYGFRHVVNTSGNLILPSQRHRYSGNDREIHLGKELLTDVLQCRQYVQMNMNSMDLIDEKEKVLRHLVDFGHL